MVQVALVLVLALTGHRRTQDRALPAGLSYVAWSPVPSTRDHPPARVAGDNSELCRPVAGQSAMSDSEPVRQRADPWYGARAFGYDFQPGPEGELCRS